MSQRKTISTESAQNNLEQKIHEKSEPPKTKKGIPWKHHRNYR